MNNYRINYKENIFLFLLGISCPILAIPFILISIYKKNIYAVFIFGLICSILIGIMPPYADTYHYYLVYNRCTNFSFYWLTQSKDFLFYFLSYIFNSLNIQYIYFRLFLVILEMFIFSWIFYDYAKCHNNHLEKKQEFFLFIIILFLSIDFMFIVFMIRYALAGTFLILSVYLFYKSKKLLSLFSLCIAITAHYGMLLFSPVFILSIVFKKRIPILLKIILCIIVLLLGVNIFNFFYKFLPQLFQSDTYTIGKWSNFEYKSFNGMMYHIIQYYIISGITIVFYFFQKKENTFLERMLFFTLILFLCISSFAELSQRVWWILKIFLSFSLISNIVKNKNNSMFSKLYFIVLLLCISQAMAVYGFRESIFDLDNLKHFLSPITFFLGDTYDDYYFFSRNF